MTQHTKRFVRCFWGLDKELASARFFPAINFRDSYSEYADDLSAVVARRRAFADWPELRARGIELLNEEVKLQQIARLVGEESLPDRERMVLEGAWVLRNAFLQQNAFDAIDRYTHAGEADAHAARRLSLHRPRHGDRRAARSRSTGSRSWPVRADLMRMRFEIPNDDARALRRADERASTRRWTR